MPDILNTPLRSQVGLLLAKVEKTYNVDARPTVSTDAFLVEKIDFKGNPKVLRRNPMRRGLGNFRLTVGQTTASLTFQHEVKAGGVLFGQSKLATLLQGCGFQLITVHRNAGSVIGRPFQTNTASNSAAANGATWSRGGTVTQGYGRYRMTVVATSPSVLIRVTGNPQDADDTILPDESFYGTVYGANPLTTCTLLNSSSTPVAPEYQIGGTLRVNDVVTAVVGGISFSYVVQLNDAASDVAAGLAHAIRQDPRMFAAVLPNAIVRVAMNVSNSEGITVTSGSTAIPLGQSGATVTPTWSGSLSKGDSWLVDLYQPGLTALPVTDNQSSMTFYVFHDGIFHKITGAMGSCKITGKAGEYVQADFTFHGQYTGFYEANFPQTGVVFEDSDPQYWQNARFTLGSYSDLPTENMTLDLNNTVTMRPNASSPQGYNGYVITQRAFTIDIDPEAVVESDWPVWEHFANSDVLSIAMQVGATEGNRVFIYSNTAQFETAPNEVDKNGLLYNQHKMCLSQEKYSGDDEIRIVFA